MNIPVPIQRKYRSLAAHSFDFDVEPMSRIDPTVQATVSTMSYPQRIAALIANAPSPPPLRRIARAESRGMSEDTRAMLLYVHTAHATYGGPKSTQPH